MRYRARAFLSRQISSDLWFSIASQEYFLRGRRRSDFSVSAYVVELAKGFLLASV